MKIDVYLEPDAFGLAALWTAPTPGIPQLNKHQIMIVILNLVIGIEWETKQQHPSPYDQPIHASSTVTDVQWSGCTTSA